MPKYHDVCVEMERLGPYLSNPVGMCLRHVNGYADGLRFRADKLLIESETYKAAVNGVDLQGLFDRNNAVEGMLVWLHDRKTNQSTQFPVLVDAKNCVVKERRKEHYGVLSDVELRLFRETESGELISWSEAVDNDETNFKPHSEEVIRASDSSRSSTGSTVAGGKARVGQAHWRERVINLWGGKCVVTGCENVRLLRGSHIKRWKPSTTAERLDEHNGLLLAPHVDLVFEVGLISFDSNGAILFSEEFCEVDRKALGVSEWRNIIGLSKKATEYLRWHRNDHGFEVDC